MQKNKKKVLIDILNQADISFSESKNNISLIEAANYGLKGDVKRLLSEGVNPNIKDELGY